MSFHIVLLEPEIPNNTGNIGRLSLASGCTLHLIKPLGFELNDARVKRAGLDYWKHVRLFLYENFDEFLELNRDKKMVYFSSHAEKQYDDLSYEEDMFLIFGKESVGLDISVLNENPSAVYKIPIHREYIRSLNLANAVSVIVYEGLRQLRRR